ncbi:response regulator transcription factor [Lysobacter sp. GCM10012299]|uniref:response regulator transcription factor n=1 Tax=Lysobacter sp. GCM10012299 TaxID=3317333 RepID=UPI00360AAB01
MLILLVESKAGSAINLAECLSSSGHVVDFASGARLGLQLAARCQFDAVVVEAGIPSCFDMVKRLRQELFLQLPILVLGQRGALNDVIAAFEVGADDYLRPPVDPREVHARLAAVSRRRWRQSSGLLFAGALKLDVEINTAWRGESVLPLTHTQLKILRALMESAPAPVRYRELELLLWGGDAPAPTCIRQHIYQLRKVVDAPFDTQLIRTQLTVGYRVQLESTSHLVA